LWSDHAIEHCFVKRSGVVAANGNKKQIEIAHGLVLHRVQALRKNLLPVAAKAQRELLLTLVGMPIGQFDQVQRMRF